MRSSSCTTLLLAVFTLAAAPGAPAAQSLPSYNVDIEETSVSGLSAGGFMATQMQVAFSSIMRGAGIIAGGVYDCAGQMNYTQCMYLASPATATSIARTNSWSGGNQIDDRANLAGHKVYMFSGTSDYTVNKSVMDRLYAYYVTDSGFIPGGNVTYKNNLNTGHTFPTDFDSPGNVACTTSSGNPWISNCGFDGAGAILQRIYGTLAARNNGAAGGSFIEFNQAEFISSPRSKGMDDTGWLYVPAGCAAGQACRLHVALHGCQQYYENIGDKFIKNTGYNKWADTNNFLILYPQTVADNTARPTNASGNLPNPNGCWDWVGWYGSNFDHKTGVQMAAIKQMIDRIAAGFSGGAPAVPTNLGVTGTTNNSVSLAWTASAGPNLAGYNVYRNGGKVNGSLVTITSYTDTGLASGTTYAYTVKAVGTGGAESTASNAVNATTGGTPPPVPAPGGLAVTGATSSSVSLSWSAASGVAGYNVYRATSAGGPWTKANASLVTGTSFTSSGLSASTTYYFVARSQNAGGTESADSNQVSATTGAAATCFTASNYHHVQAGRAYASGGYALARGSNQNMGLYNVFYTTTLKQTGPDYYIIGTCP